MSDEQFFQQGKWVNVGLSILILIVVGIVFNRYFSSWYSAGLLWLSAFTVFVYRAPYFQAELLYYFFAFAAFVMMLELISRPAWPKAVALGFVSALAFYTKGSLLLGLVIFIVFMVAKALYCTAIPDNGVSPGKLFVNTGLACLVFLMAIFPYIQQNKRIFGQYFYNVNTTFYIWMDSWPEAKTFGTDYQWPDIPKEEVPSLTKYLRDHTWQQALNREWRGFVSLKNANCASSDTGPLRYGNCKYLFGMGILASIALVGSALAAKELFGKHKFAVVFVLTYLTAYLVLYAWYVPIANGPRFFLSIFLPIIFSLSLIITHPKLTLLKLELFDQDHFSLNMASLSLVLLFMSLPIDLYFILSHRIMLISGPFS